MEKLTKLACNMETVCKMSKEKNMSDIIFAFLLNTTLPQQNYTSYF